MMSNEDITLLDEDIDIAEREIHSENAAQTQAKLQDTIQTIDLSEEKFSLLQKIGSGCSVTTSTCLVNLRFAYFGGAGLQLQASLQQQPLTLWMNEQQWCEWSQPILSFPALKNVPDELHTVLAQYTLARLEQCLELENVPSGTVDTLVPVHIPHNFSLMIDLLQNGVSLSIGIVNAPILWQQTLTEKLCAESLNNQDHSVLSDQFNPSEKLRAHYDQIQTWTLPCVAGYTCIEYDQLSRLNPGDALALDKSCDIANGAVWIQQRNRLYGVRPQTETATNLSPDYHVENIAALPETMSKNMAVITAQVGYLTIPIDDLWCLKTGEIFNCHPHFYPSVQLTLDNQIVAEGQLLQIGGSWLVKIVQLYKKSNDVIGPSV